MHTLLLFFIYQLLWILSLFKFIAISIILSLWWYNFLFLKCLEGLKFCHEFFILFIFLEIICYLVIFFLTFFLLFHLILLLILLSALSIETEIPIQLWTLLLLSPSISLLILLIVIHIQINLCVVRHLLIIVYIQLYCILLWK
jgi:hypothetical protein